MFISFNSMAPGANEMKTRRPHPGNVNTPKSPPLSVMTNFLTFFADCVKVRQELKDYAILT